MIVVDDASPEDIRSIVTLFAADSRIRYYRNKNNCGALNVVDNWNICLSYCTGDYVICIGDDDKLLPGCLEEYARLIGDHPSLNVYHGFTEIIDENSNVFDLQQQRPEWESGLSFVWHRWNSRTRQYIGDFCYSVEHLRSKGGFYKLPLAWASDDITAARAALNGGIANTNKPVFQYRVNRYTISRSANNIYKIEAIKQERKWYIDNYLRKHDSLSELDCIYYSILNTQFEKHWEDKFLDYLTQDLKNNHLHIFIWISKRNHYGYSFKTALRAFKRSLR